MNNDLWVRLTCCLSSSFMPASCAKIVAMTRLSSGGGELSELIISSYLPVWIAVAPCAYAF